MNLFKSKTKITIEEHAARFLLAAYKFDPIPDFIRISREGLLTGRELERLKNNDHYLLTAQEIEHLYWLWTKGKIENLPKTLDGDEASDRLGYWFGYNLALAYGGISGKVTATRKTEKALQEIQYYMKEIADKNGVKLELAYKFLASVFVLRVLGKDTGRDSLYDEKRFYVSYFAEQILIGAEKESRKLSSSVQFVYRAPEQV